MLTVRIFSSIARKYNHKSASTKPRSKLEITQITLKQPITIFFYFLFGWLIGLRLQVRSLRQAFSSHSGFSAGAPTPLWLFTHLPHALRAFQLRPATDSAHEKRQAVEFSFQSLQTFFHDLISSLVLQFENNFIGKILIKPGFLQNPLSKPSFFGETE
ncbi:MAG: hypothetical protein Q4F57_02725 [Weeksellaceae bacterium]|nr:hypothetical protein [Weeksellaceae bacterium]